MKNNCFLVHFCVLVLCFCTLDVSSFLGLSGFTENKTT